MPAKSRRGLLVIAAFKLLNAALLVLATFGIVHLFHKNVAHHTESWLDFFRIDTDNELVGAVLWRLRVVHTHQLKELAALSAFYAALFLTEGVGLALKQRWAEYLTLVATGLFIPVELYELWKQPGAAKAILLVINLCVLAYLAWVVRENNR